MIRALAARLGACMTLSSHTVRLDFNSAFDMLDFVQVVERHMSRLVGFDDDALHWVSVAVRESVINAIKHGNQGDESKRVIVEFTTTPANRPTELAIRVQDQGEGFDPEEVADPLAPENLLKSSGRGIFLIRSFMDEVVAARMSRRRHGDPHGEAPGRVERRHAVTGPDPRFLATAIEVVIDAGALQLARFGSALQIDKKGAIDLVTEVDVEVERAVRALIAERFPDHDILAEELGGGERGRSHRWVFDPLDGTTNFAHGLPIFCASLALEIDGEAVVGAVFDPNRQELFTAERGVGAWLNGAPLRVSRTATLIDAVLVTGFPYDVHRTLDDVIGLFAAFVGEARAVRRLGSAAIDLC